MNKKTGLVRNDGGFIKIALLIIIGLAVLKYAYDIDVLNYVIKFWEKYREPLTKIWQTIKTYLNNIFS